MFSRISYRAINSKYVTWIFYDEYTELKEWDSLQDAETYLREKEKEEDNKCTDCNEYNQEKHYCPKFCDVIRETDKEMREFYKGEHEKLEKIEQVVNQWNDRKDADAWAYREIKKVLEKE